MVLVSRTSRVAPEPSDLKATNVDTLLGQLQNALAPPSFPFTKGSATIAINEKGHRLRVWFPSKERPLAESRNHDLSYLR